MRLTTCEIVNTIEETVKASKIDFTSWHISLSDEPKKTRARYSIGYICNCMEAEDEYTAKSALDILTKNHGMKKVACKDKDAIFVCIWAVPSNIDSFNTKKKELGISISLKRD